MPSITPVRIMLEPATGIARRMAITSTARVENPSVNATEKRMDCAGPRCILLVANPVDRAPDGTLKLIQAPADLSRSGILRPGISLGFRYPPAIGITLSDLVYDA